MKILRLLLLLLLPHICGGVVVATIISLVRNKVRKNVKLATAQLGLSGGVPIT